MQFPDTEADDPVAVQYMLSRKEASSSFLQETFSPLSEKEFVPADTIENILGARSPIGRTLQCGILPGRYPYF